MNFLVGSYFNNFNLKTMRIFKSMDKAIDYMLGLHEYNFRIYEINNRGNKLVMTPKKFQKLGWEYKWAKKYGEKGKWVKIK